MSTINFNIVIPKIEISWTLSFTKNISNDTKVSSIVFWIWLEYSTIRILKFNLPLVCILKSTNHFYFMDVRLWGVSARLYQTFLTVSLMKPVQILHMTSGIHLNYNDYMTDKISSSNIYLAIEYSPFSKTDSGIIHTTHGESWRRIGTHFVPHEANDSTKVESFWQTYHSPNKQICNPHDAFF